MASSRCLLLLLHLLVFAAAAAAKMSAKPSLPINYVSLHHFNDDEYVAKIAKFGLQAYKDAQNSRARNPSLPQLTDERWIDVGIKIVPTKLGISARYCVLFSGLVFPPQFEQFNLEAIVQIKFTIPFGALLTLGNIDQSSIRVHKIEYHPV
ncbi:hypothetical protein AXF42_Ash019060 [Apostasia shenzhenica]|uniref:Uncharacterized protein n=1 Tax=Apostasia shenzhenica TaxID=1088818 RepID=A0A2I0BB70_9ASPA|nr:hypothetical protein AXF42_Ash019060 [Apostasia shenzhenica]